MRSLGLATDLLALGAAAEVERHADRVVVRTPGEPDFWSGNFVIRLTPPEPPEREEARFRADFPEAAHLRVGWDDPALDPEALRGPWAERGAEVEVDDMLAREGPPPETLVPDGYALRALDPARSADWEDVLSFALTMAGEEGYSLGFHEPFLRGRFAARRVDAAGRLRWWVACHRGRIVAQMGLVEGEVPGGLPGEVLGRFQAVATHPAHRRRGLCAALLAQAARASRASRLVIVAEADAAPGRLYRRAGFRFVERTVAVQRAGY